MNDLENITDFDDLAEWIMGNPESLWQSMFLDVPMPYGFTLSNLTMGDPVYQERLLQVEAKGGFSGVLKFTSNYRTTMEQSIRMFRQMKIVIREEVSFVIENEKGFERAVANNLHTHTLRYHMFADDWLNLSVFKRLSA